MIFGLPRTMRVALFESLRHGYIMAAADHFERVDGYVRVSQYVLVSFPPLEASAPGNPRLAELDRVEAGIQADCEKRLMDIRRQRAHLLAAIEEPRKEVAK